MRMKSAHHNEKYMSKTSYNHASSATKDVTATLRISSAKANRIKVLDNDIESATKSPAVISDF
jgi:hypothetical protein